MTSLRKALLLSLGQRYMAFVVQFVASLVLARLLTPAEVGIFALAAAVVAIAHLLRDFGVGEYIIQERDLTRERLRAAFSATLMMAWLIAGLIYVFAHQIAAFYGTPGIAATLYVLAFNFVLLPFGSTTFAVLSREMAFAAIFFIQTASAIASAVVTILLAYHGYSYMSMAWGSLVGTITTVFMLTLLRPAEMLLVPSFKSLRRVGRFGGMLTVGRLMEQVSRRAPDLLIGNGLGLHAVGIFSKAASMLDIFHDFFTAAISRVALPAFVNRHRGRTEARADYLQGIQLLGIFPLAFFGFLNLFADPLIYLLFGPQWIEVAPVLRIMSLGGLLYAPYLLAAPALTANSQVRALMRIDIASAAILLPMIGFATRLNLEAVAIAAAIGGTAKLGLLQFGLRSGLDLRFVDLLRALSPSAFTVALAVLVSAPGLLVYEQSYRGAAFALTLGTVLALSSGGLTLFAIGHPLAAELRRLATARRR